MAKCPTCGKCRCECECPTYTVAKVAQAADELTAAGARMADAVIKAILAEAKA
jgi:hypothetical protein